MKRALLILLPLAFLTGCPVTQSQDTPVDPVRLVEPRTRRGYRLYVPSYHTKDRQWPMVIVLHGTRPYDSAWLQMKEWKALAEEKGLIVVCPELDSSQGILPVIPDLWWGDLEEDERAVLAIYDEVAARYNVDRKAVMLTAFSAGGYSMYWIGLQNPRRFSSIVGRGCNIKKELLERLKLTEASRKVPVMLFWGKDDLPPIQKQGWLAVQYLRGQRNCFNVEWDEVSGGHLRRPELNYRYWLPHLPKPYRK